MIFVDESGKRWKRIKHSAAAITVVGILPLGALIIGSLIYKPNWGLLPLAKQAASAALALPAQLQPDKPALKTLKITPKPAVTRSQLRKQPSYPASSSIGPNSNPTSPASSSNPTTTPDSTSTTPTATPTPTPTSTTPYQPQPVTPTSSNPDPNYYGQSHKPVK